MFPAVFLPGILMPASLRYAPLLAELDPARTLVTKELEIYRDDAPPADYSLDTEVEGLDRFADEHGFDRFHLYGHSAGGATALAYVAAHGARVLSLALDEPASDFSDDDRRSIDPEDSVDLDALPESERLAAFMRTLVRPEVELPPPPDAPPNPEMAKRPAGLLAFRNALLAHQVDAAALRSFARPVYFSYGSLSNERWELMATRLHELFPRCTLERYAGLHHLNTSHAVEPARVAAALEQMWSAADHV